MSQHLLFLCTGNYFRSRFAEIVFNHLASTRELSWTAESRGIATELGRDNIGSISGHTLRGLAQRGIPAPEPFRFPIQLAASDLLQAQRVVALKEAEHRPIIATKFPLWIDRIEYWHVHDLDCAPPDDAMAAIETAVTGLIERLDQTGA